VPQPTAPQAACPPAHNGLLLKL